MKHSYLKSVKIAPATLKFNLVRPQQAVQFANGVPPVFLFRPNRVTLFLFYEKWMAETFIFVGGAMKLVKFKFKPEACDYKS